ncbi:MAG TPA: type II secretion system protein GspM [Baekduia sp.]|nr:type II secretion system protein GspM [Baekduia sp.]
MTARDRTVLIVVGILAVLGGFWFLAISPKRKDAADVQTQITAAQARLDTAQASAASAEAAKAKYSADYATVARLGKAVPVDDDMPSLVYTLEQTAKANKVDFRSIKLTGTVSQAAAPTGAAAAVASANGNTNATAASSTSPASTVTAALPPGATVGTAGFPTMPFSFDFTGSFFNMQRFLKAVDGLTTVQGKSINVKGRLLTVDGVGLKAGPKGFPQVDATVVVTAYLLPSDEGLTAGATAPATGAATTGSTATASLIGSDR